MSARHNSGLALILVLWVLMLLTIIAGSFAFAMRNEAVITGNLQDRVRAGALAEAGIARVIFGLTHSGDDTEFPADGRAHVLRLDAGEARVVIRAERAKIDINRAPEDVLRSLGERILGPEEADAFADSILDWRDKNDARRLNGAEDDDYESLGLPYGARDGLFMTVHELTQLPMITDEVFEQLAPLVTVESKSRRVNASTATRDVLLAIPGLTEDNVDAYIAAREDSAEGSNPRVHLSGAEAFLDLREVRRGREVINVSAEGRTPDGAVAHRQVTLRVRRNRPRILAWSRSAEGVNFKTVEELELALTEEQGSRTQGSVDR